MKQFARVQQGSAVIPGLVGDNSLLDLRPLIPDITPDTIASGVLTKVNTSTLKPIAGDVRYLAPIHGVRQIPATGFNYKKHCTKVRRTGSTLQGCPCRLSDTKRPLTTVLPVRDWKWQDLQQIRWAADGKSLFAVAPSSSSLALLSIDANGKPRVLYEIVMGVGWTSNIVPSPDGRSLAFTKRMFANDVMLLENF